MKKIIDAIKKAFKFVGIGLYCVFAFVSVTFMGCATMMPTFVPPGVEELGYDAPLNYKGVTLVALNQAQYEIEVTKLAYYAKAAELVNQPAIEMHKEIINMAGIITTGGTALLPFAWKRQPKKKKEV